MQRSLKRFDLARFFAALSEHIRLRLLNLMGDREVCVCYFVEILGQSQPKISRHLAYLRSAGIVSARREGKWMHYRLVTPPHPGAAQILRQTLAALKQEKDMQPRQSVLFAPEGRRTGQRPAAGPPRAIAPVKCVHLPKTKGTDDQSNESVTPVTGVTDSRFL